MIMIDGLVDLLGKVICYDANTVARKRLVYVKTLIEITHDKSRTSVLKVRLDESFCQGLSSL